MKTFTSSLQALYNAATSSYQRGEFVSADQLLGEALKLDPQSPELWCNRGVAQAADKRFEEALQSLDRALQLRPNFLNAIANRAHVLFVLQRYAAAIPDYEATLGADADHAYAAGELMFCKLQCCDWCDFEDQNASIRIALQMGKRVVPPVLSVALFDSPADQLHAAQILARDKFAPTPQWSTGRYAHERIRVAYLSADFHDHATALLTAGLFEDHDRHRFEIVAVSFGPDDNSAMRARLMRAFDRFIDVRKESDAAVAMLLRRSEIDIAVDLKGYTKDARPGIFAGRCAPVQVNYLGFPGTMGADFADYILADRFVIPQDHKIYYSEKIVWLPDSYQPNDRTRKNAAAASRVAAGLPESGFVFCCFNNSFKIQPRLFDVWMRLLGNVEGSTLWLLQDNPVAAENLKRETAARGIDARRLIFAPRTRFEDHLARHRLADLFLDTLPYNAHTTASDALWAGLPILTCLGSTFAGRVAASVLEAAGLPELIAHSLDDYERIALDLAQHPSALLAVKAKLEKNRDTCPLFDTRRITRHLESAYSTMWERQQRGLPFESFVVPTSG